MHWEEDINIQLKSRFLHRLFIVYKGYYHT